MTMVRTDSFERQLLSTVRGRMMHLVPTIDEKFRESNPEKKANAPGAFGRILRFWRTTFGKSQEDLSWEVGVSTRHISFLESGRSQPSRGTILFLAEAFNLGLRDTNNMLVAGGFFPEPLKLNQDMPDLRRMQKSLVIALSGLDPHPSAVADPYGNILMINKAWLRFYRDNSPPGLLDGPLNIYRLYFRDDGLRPRLMNWDNLACAYLMTLQQEVLLNENPVGQQILDELLTYPNIPQDWKQRAVFIPHSFYYTIYFRLKDNSKLTYQSVISTVGATPYVTEPRLLFHTFYPKDGRTYSTLEELEHDESLLHPLLFY